MKISRGIEITVGLFVALGLAALLMLAMKVSNLTETSNGDGGYEIVARFENVGGLKVRSPVKMGGVRIGRVKAIGYDSQKYQAMVRMTIERQYDKIPTDTTFSIYTSGLLGEQYVGLEPGGEETYLKEGDEISIKNTQEALVLEKALGQFLYNKAASGDSSGDSGGAKSAEKRP
mgnify:CR=1 FL=1